MSDVGLLIVVVMLLPVLCMLWWAVNRRKPAPARELPPDYKHPFTDFNEQCEKLGMPEMKQSGALSFDQNIMRLAAVSAELMRREIARQEGEAQR